MKYNVRDKIKYIINGSINDGIIVGYASDGRYIVECEDDVPHFVNQSDITTE